jgi:beta-glucosidase
VNAPSTRGNQQDAGERARALLGAMTLDEKIALALSDFPAVAHLGLPPLVYTDSGNGVREAEGVTAFPVALALAATFDVDLAEAYGAAIGREARSAGRNVLLGPSVDIVRTPLGGRSAESLGEDPCLAGALAASGTQPPPGRIASRTVAPRVGSRGVAPGMSAVTAAMSSSGLVSPPWSGRPRCVLAASTQLEYPPAGI